MQERRKDSRFDMDNYPASLVSRHGEKIRVSIGNISISGLLIKCSEESVQTVVGDKIGFFTPSSSNQFDLHAIFPDKSKLKKLDATCRIVYIFKAAKEKDPEHAVYIGLKIENYQGNSEQVFYDILTERKLPKISSTKN